MGANYYKKFAQMGMGWQKISEIEVTADCDYVEWTELDGNSDWFYKILGTIRNPTASDVHCAIYVNGDTADTNYYHQEFYANDVNRGSARLNDADLLYMIAGIVNPFEALISFNLGGQVRVQARQSSRGLTDVALRFIDVAYTHTVSNLTSLRLQADVAGAIGAGSKFILFKARVT